MVEIAHRDAARDEVAFCPLCRANRKYHRFFESVEHDSGLVTYQICRRCGMVFQTSVMSPQEREAFYRSGYREMVQGSERPTEKDVRVQRARAAHLLRFVRSEVDAIERCLDIGSSTGILVETFQEIYGCHGLGVEPGVAYREFSIERGIDTVVSLSEIDPAMKNHFDFITMSHVLEHLPDPVDYLRELKSDWLAPKGSILLEVPNLYGHQSFEPSHLLAFSMATLRQTLRSAGLQPVRAKVHGRPRSLLIPLYLTVLARGRASEVSVTFRGARSVGLKRRLGMAWRRWATRFFSRWAWLPWPDEAK